MKGDWAEPFEPDRTMVLPFHRSTNRQVEASLMHQGEQVRCMENEPLPAVEVPYHGGELWRVILLPRQVHVCGSLEDQLRAKLLSTVLGQIFPHPHSRRAFRQRAFPGPIGGSNEVVFCMQRFLPGLVYVLS